MTDQDLQHGSRCLLVASIIGILLFVVNLVLGKIEVKYKVDTIVHLEGVPEFLLLLVSVILFMGSTLLKERTRDEGNH